MRRRFTLAISEEACARVGVAMRFDACAMFCADIIRDVLGYDPAAPWRGRYTTARGLRRILGKRGIAGAVAQAARAHRWRRIAPGQAQAGDIGLLAADSGLAVVIKHGRLFVGAIDGGFSAYEPARVIKAWSVL